MKSFSKNSVFIISVIIVAVLVFWGILAPASFENVANMAFGFLTGKFGWLYTTSLSIFVIVCLYLCFSKYGKIKLGDDDDVPEHSMISWFAMLFSAGMGIGLVFWGVAEPLNYYINGIVGESGSAEAASFAIEKSIFHWGIHPWACFCVISLGLAYNQFRKHRNGLVSSLFIPLIGEEKAAGPVGKVIDILSVFATVAGVATSLGLGTMQINSGLHYLFGVPENKTVQVLIIVVVTCLFLASAISGINKGIKILSNTNVVLVSVGLVLAFIIGPSVMQLDSMTEGFGNYIQNFIGESFQVGTFDPDKASFYSGWTIFYWAWWIAWTPFVGSFIARISKGRTIREFVLGVMLVPAALAVLWFGVFGTMGINLGPDVAAEAIQNTSTACFVIFSHYKGGAILSFIILVLVCTFFVTSADSATMVLGIFSTNGDLNPKTHYKVIWGILESALALALLVGTSEGAGLSMLQTISIVAAFPFAFILMAIVVSLFKMLRAEIAPQKKEEKVDAKVISTMNKKREEKKTRQAAAADTI